MDLILIGQLFAVVLLIMGNAFFVGSEVALTAARRSRIRQLADLGNKSAKTVQLLHEEPERFYSVTQIGITLVSLGLGAIGMDTVSKLIDPAFEGIFGIFGESDAILKAAHTSSYVVAFAVVSFFHVVGGELAPKVLAFHKAEAMSLGIGGVINFTYILFKPVIWIMNKSANALLISIGQGGMAGHGDHFSMTPEEVRMILSASEQTGSMNPDDTKMIRGIFNLADLTVREVMIPRTEILAVSKDATLSEALQVFRTVTHARFPVFEDSLDNIVGIMVIKEVLGQFAQAQLSPSSENSADVMKVGEIMHPVYTVPNTKSLNSLLLEFKNTRQQMAVVVDEYGGTEGIITLEDILEEIVGEYADEFTPHQRRRIKKLVGSQYEIDASVRVSDLEEILNYPFPKDEDYVTLGGLIYKILGRVPNVGDKIELAAANLQVLGMDNHRITKVLFQDTAIKEDGTTGLAEEKSPSENISESHYVSKEKPLDNDKITH
jgi:putative hemolysin